MPKKSSSKSLKTRKFICNTVNTTIKSRGVFFLLFVVFIGAIAVNSGNNLVYLTFSTILSFILISGFLSFSNLRNINAEIKFPDFVFANKNSTGILTLKTNHNYPKFRLKAKIFNKTFAIDILTDKYSANLTHTFTKRGVYKMPDLSISSDFPFGFFERKRTIEITKTIIIFPEIRNIALNKAYGETETDRNMKKNEGEEFYSVRKYIEGEDSRKINWKLTAKANDIIVIETKAEDNSFEIAFDTSSYLYKDNEEFEDALVKISSFVYKCFIKNIPISFIFNTKNIGKSNGKNHYREIFEMLATAKITDTPPVRIPANAVTFKDIRYV